ncbi:MAG: tRNA (adenosine(37)-N6)-dimethylallyltransferase MiaA [Myxococcota bacterium]
MVSQDLTPIVIAGPTGSGKSALAMKMAKELGGEIVCADSRQIYERMSIGTAAPSQEEYILVKHHGFEHLDPKEVYSAGRFVTDTDAFVQEIQSRGKVPLIVGGTGLYLRAWRFGLADVLPSDPQVRARLEQQDLSDLYLKLQEVDPASAAKIKATDPVRILRALEILEISGQPASQLRHTDWAREPRVNARWLLLKPSKEELDQRLKQRVDQMFEAGLVAEAVALRDYLGPAASPKGLLGTPGYAESLALVDGLLTEQEMFERTFIRHRQYAKQQVTWFQKESWWAL